MREMHRMARETAETLLRECGHVLTVDDLPDLARLDRLAHQATDPASVKHDVFDWPVRVGGVELYRLTLGAIGWLEDVVAPAMGGQDSVTDLAVAYAMAHGHAPAVLALYITEAAIAAELRRFRRGLTCTPEQLSAAVASLLPYNDATVGGDDSKYGEIIGLLCREYGQTPEHWLWGVSFEVCQALLSSLVAAKQAEAEAYARANRGKGTRPPPMPHSRLVGLKAFKDAANELRAKWQK